MNANTSARPTSGLGTLGTVLFAVVLLVALQYLQNFLFSESGLEGKEIIKGTVKANPDKSYVTIADELPALYEGGEYSFNFWLQINDYEHLRGHNKHVLSIGGGSFATLLVYLGPQTSNLAVRVHTRDASVGAQPAGSAATPLDAAANLTTEAITSLFGNAVADSSLISQSRPCDINNVELQKWVQVTITLNNKTCDVQIDGKLARSCVLPSFQKVDKSGLSLRVAEQKGFGGFLSNVSAQNYALNPEQVWRLQMSGPGRKYSFTEQLKSLFDPNAVSAFDYPKQNIV